MKQVFAPRFGRTLKISRLRAFRRQVGELVAKLTGYFR